MQPPRRSAVSSGRRLGALLIAALSLGLAHAESLDSSAQRRLREGTLEVVLEKPETDPLTYEKPLPLELLPYAERQGRYSSVGTAFAIARGQFVTAAHVIGVGVGAPKGSLALRDQGGNVYAIDKVLKYSAAEDYAVFTLRGAPKITPLDTHDPPPLNDPVFAVGNALGEGIIIRDGLYTSDTPEEREGRWKWMRFSAAASPGNSGGPLVDRKGRVIGVILRKSPSENLNVAVAIGQILKGDDKWATVESRFPYRFAMMRASDINEINDRFALPLAADEFFSALHAEFVDTLHKAQANYRAQHGDRMFPHGADSEQLLHSLYVANFPRAIEERSDGVWGVSDPKPQRAQLDQNGFVETAPFPGGTLVRIRKPDDVKWADLFIGSRQYGDLVLKGHQLHRQVGSDSVRITSLGAASTDTIYADGYGRTWQVRTWLIPYNNTVMISLALPTPQGYVAIVSERPRAFQDLSIEEFQTLTGYIYLSFDGTLKQWQEYLSAPLPRPDAVRALELQPDYGKSLQLRSRRVTLSIADGLTKIDPESMLVAKFGYFEDGGAVVWDLAGVLLQDPQRKGNWIDVLRHQRPPASFPEAFRERWHTLETGSHPYTAMAYSTNGGTRIDAVQDLQEVSAGHRSIAYTVTVVAEGTQDQATMKRALDTVQQRLTVLERN
jgi:hypothetical protein